jgi:hypothetical protein
MKDEELKPPYIPQDECKVTCLDLAITSAVFLGVMVVVTVLFCFVEIKLR